jgi:hypothetical protein
MKAGALLEARNNGGIHAALVPEARDNGGNAAALVPERRDNEGELAALVPEARDNGGNLAALVPTAEENAGPARRLGPMPSPVTEAERAEARDPATPPERLAALLESCTEEVLANPGLPLLLVSEPDFWARVDLESLVAAAESRACPLSLAFWLTRQEHRFHRALECVFQNRALPGEVRRAAMLNWPSTAMTAEVWDHYFACLADFLSPAEVSLLRRGATETVPSKLSPEEFRQLAALGKCGRELAIQHDDCPAELLASFLEQGFRDALRHANLPRHLLAQALSDADVEVREWAVRNPALTAEDYRKAVTDPGLRRIIGDIEGMPVDCYAALLDVPDRDLQERLAMNPSLPATCVAAMIARGDVDQLVRLAYGHPALTPEAQLALATHPAPHVRKYLSDNPALTDEVRRIVEAQSAT